MGHPELAHQLHRCENWSSAGAASIKKLEPAAPVPHPRNGDVSETPCRAAVQPCGMHLLKRPLPVAADPPLACWDGVHRFEIRFPLQRQSITPMVSQLPTPRRFPHPSGESAAELIGKAPGLRESLVALCTVVGDRLASPVCYCRYRWSTCSWLALARPDLTTTPSWSFLAPLVTRILWRTGSIGGRTFRHFTTVADSRRPQTAGIARQ